MTLCTKKEKIVLREITYRLISTNSVHQKSLEIRYLMLRYLNCLHREKLLVMTLLGKEQ